MRALHALVPRRLTDARWSSLLRGVRRSSLWCVVSEGERVVTVHHGMRTYSLPFFMLRESCPSHFDAKTRQRVVPSASLQLDARPARVVSEHSTLVVHWSDGHTSRYPGALLDALSLLGAAPQEAHTLWNKDTMVEAFGTAPSVDFVAFQTNELWLDTWLSALHTHGLALLRGAPLRTGIVEEVANRFAYVRETHYGRVFEVVSTPSPTHLAYSSTGLDPHTDLNYRESSPGIQLLHCIRADAQGGESTYVDGFAAADRLRAENARHFHILSSVPLTFKLVDGKASHSWRVPAIVLNPQFGHVEAIHWNERTRQPISLTRNFLFTQSSAGAVPVALPVTVQEVYEALVHFDKILNDPSMLLEFRLVAGDVIAFNNRRVLHGRRPFKAPNDQKNVQHARHLQGCYVEYDEFFSALRKRDLFVM